MKIEINPTSLLNLEHICEVFYKLHPSVLDMLIEMERTFGKILGFIDKSNMSMEEREFVNNNYVEGVYLSEAMEEDSEEDNAISDILNKRRTNNPNANEIEIELNCRKFDTLRKYLQLNTDEYIPIKISVEVEDPVIGKKVRELVRALEKTRAPEQFYLNKKEMDEEAYFAEGYGPTMNEEQKKKSDEFFWGADVEALKELLKKEKLYP